MQPRPVSLTNRWPQPLPEPARPWRAGRTLGPLLGLLLVGVGARAQIRPPDAPALVALKDTNYSIPAGAVYVSPTGRTSNTGTSLGSPWPAEHALLAAPAGATIVFRGGTYRDVSADIPKRLTLQAYPGEKPWLRGSKIVTGWASDGPTRWVKTGWTYAFPSNSDPHDIDPNYPLAGHRDMVFVNDVPLVQVATLTEVGPGTFFVSDAEDKLYLGDNPGGKTVEATAYGRAFNLALATNIDPSGAIVRGLGFTHYADRGVQVNAPNVVLENNTFSWNGKQGASLNWPATGAVIRGNTFACNGAQGLGASSSHRLLLENNAFTHNNVELFNPGWSACGAKVIRTVDLVARGNVLERNFGNGLWIDISCQRATVVWNGLRANNSVGIVVELSDNVIVAFNLVRDSKYNAGIWVQDSSRVRVFNNTLSRNKMAIRIHDSTRVNDNPNEAADGITWVTRGTVLKNNLFSNVHALSTEPLLDVSNCPPRWTGEPASLLIAASDHNGYYRTNASAPPTAIKWSLGAGAGPCETGYNTLAAFRNAQVGYETNAIGIDNQAANPFFWEEATGDFRLKPGSPALFRGEALPLDIAQAAGVAQSPVHLGALGEAVASGPLYRLDYGSVYFFLTASADEHNFLVSVGWTSRGAQGRLYGEAAGAPDLVALFRLYNPYNGDHFYTANPAERNAAVAGGYVPEGVAGFVLTQAGLGRKPLLRAYNPSTGQHRFTGDQAEYNALPTAWIREGVAAYLVAAAF